MQSPIYPYNKKEVGLTSTLFSKSLYYISNLNLYETNYFHPNPFHNVAQEFISAVGKGGMTPNVGLLAAAAVLALLR
jgi:hypothetical protein